MVRSPRRGRLSGLILIGTSLFAAARLDAFGSRFNYVALDLGIYGDNLKQRFTTTPSYQSKVSSYSFFGRFRRGFHLGKQIYWEPSAAVILPWISSTDGTALSFPFQFGLDFSLPVFRFLRFRAGPGIFTMVNIVKGGTVSLNNGTTTSNFYTPNHPVAQLLFTLDSGLQLAVYRQVVLGLDLFVQDVASSPRRRFNAALTLGIKL